MTGLVLLSGAVSGQAAKPKDAAAAAPAASAPTGQYKIGVVSRKAVIEGYTKVKAEQTKLETEKKARQKDVDALFDEFQAAKTAFDGEKDTLSPTEKTDRQADVESKYRTYQQKLQSEQTRLDDLERTAMKKVFTEIDEVVDKIGAEKGYHLILEGSSKTGAIYYSPTIDISQQVIDELNKKS